MQDLEGIGVPFRIETKFNTQRKGLDGEKDGSDTLDMDWTGRVWSSWNPRRCCGRRQERSHHECEVSSATLSFMRVFHSSTAPQTVLGGKK